MGPSANICNTLHLCSLYRPNSEICLQYSDLLFPDLKVTSQFLRVKANMSHQFHFSSWILIIPFFPLHFGIFNWGASTSYFILPVLFSIHKDLFCSFPCPEGNFAIMCTHCRWGVLNTCTFTRPHCPWMLLCASHPNKDSLLWTCSIVRIRNWLLVQYFLYCHFLGIHFSPFSKKNQLKMMYCIYLSCSFKLLGTGPEGGSSSVGWAHALHAETLL